MEQVLDVYERPYDPLFPVVNLDESPKQLIGQVYEPFVGSNGTLYQDYEYCRRGTVSIYMIVEALRGYRQVLVREDHKATTYAGVIRYIAETLYPAAKKITLVEDNLSAHKLATLYEVLPPAKARALIKRIELVRTPKHGSWLNIAESELSVLTRFGLKQRTATREQLIQDATVWCDKRNRENPTIDWRFTTQDARIKLKHLYPKFHT